MQLTNTGSADDTFSLGVTGLPAGVTASFVETSNDVPPGAGNDREVALTLTVAPGTTPARYPFTVMAASTSDPSVSTTAGATLTIAASGVKVSLSPGSGAQGSTFQATVTNMGSIADTFMLALAGPAAVVASLAFSRVTLGAGASQVVPVSTGALAYALEGSLPFAVVATSSSNPAVQAGSSADVSIPSTQGFTASLSPASQTLSQPGMATFTLFVQNTGNTQDSYSATITTTSGPVTANLVGVNASPTQSIPAFTLPGFSTAAIELEVDLAAIGKGTVAVVVQSLANPAIVMTAVATVGTATSQPVPTDGPEVTQVLRYGYHWMPTTLAVIFNQALDPATAEDAKDYRIIGPAGRTIRVVSAVYDPATFTVTLHPAQRINIHHKYELVIAGTGANGMKNTFGQLLDGTRSGKPGSDFKAALTWRELVLDPPPHKALHKSTARETGVNRKTATR